MYQVHLASYTYRRKGKITNRETGERKLLAPEKLKPETIRHWLRTATAVLRWAVEQEWVATMPKVPKLPTPMRQNRDVAPERLREILSALPERAGRILRFIAYTGCRPSEACRLDWSHVHLDLGVCILPVHKTAAKSGKPRTIYLTAEAADVLRGMRPATGPVFTNRYGRRYTPAGLRSILRRRGGVTPYQLRHTFAQVASDTLTRDELAVVLGHKTDRTTGFYFEVRDKRAQAAVGNIRLGLTAQKAG